MAFRRLTDEEILAQIPGARARAARSLRTQPRAEKVTFPPGKDAIEVRLINGVMLRVPLSLVPALQCATPIELNQVEVDRFGLTLHWECLDADLTIGQLAILALGRSTVMRASAAAAGSVRSPAKAAASRRNGQKGGRPRKSTPT
jgi:hypothetical protein